MLQTSGELFILIYKIAFDYISSRWQGHVFIESQMLFFFFFKKKKNYSLWIQISFL